MKSVGESTQNEKQAYYACSITELFLKTVELSSI